MTKILRAVLALLVLPSVPPPAQAGEPYNGEPYHGEGEKRERTLYFFFSEKTPGAPEAARAAAAFLRKGGGGLELRPALLVEDWRTFRKVDPSSPLYRTIRELGEGISLPIFDEEALRLARAWKLTRLPAFVLVERGRAHVLRGAAGDLEGILRCSR